jgi:hypothetical protein
MADLTTVDGKHVSFVPDAVTAVTDQDEHGTPVTCVFGITPAPLEIGEAVAGFLARIGVTANFARLTRPNGSAIWVCGPAVSSLSASLPGDDPDGARAVIVVGGRRQAVEEDAASVKAAVDAHGGKL